jgi:hypothetical protein
VRLLKLKKQIFTTIKNYKLVNCRIAELYEKIENIAFKNQKRQAMDELKQNLQLSKRSIEFADGNLFN